MAIFDPSHFEGLFAPFRGKRIGFVPLLASSGDLLSHEATRLLFEHFRIDYESLPSFHIDYRVLAEAFDELVISGGDHLGGALCRHPSSVPQKLLETGRPLTVFPRSFVEPHPDPEAYRAVYVRERASQTHNPRLPLAPDLATGYLGSLEFGPPLARTGLFLREDAEEKPDRPPCSLGDPAALAATASDLLDLAARFHHVVTDRLSFAVAALLLGREVTLLPNAYFKNRAFYETWLSDKCDWMDAPTPERLEDEELPLSLLLRLLAAPSELLDPAAVPMQDPGYFLDRIGEHFRLRHADGVQSIASNVTGAMVWELSNGSHSVGDIIELITAAFPGPGVSVARDVHRALRRLSTLGAVVLEPSPCPLPDEERGPTGPPPPGAPAVAIKTRPLDLTIRPPQEVEGEWTISASMDGKELWFAVGPELRDDVTPFADPFVRIGLTIAMRAGRPMRVHGAPVSTGLLRNLEQFQAAWTTWRKRLTGVEIQAEEAEAGGTRRDGALAAFSGGVDSCYTMYRHRIDPESRRIPDIQGALLIHGFDIGAEDEVKFAHSFANAQRLLRDTGVSLLSVRTNAKEFIENWLDSHGLVLAANLSVLSHRFSMGVIGSTLPYVILQPLGSNPTTDWMMGSDSFTIFHHGAAASRLDKVRAIANWKAVHHHLRVCWEGTSPDTLNCGECFTCVLTAIMFHCLGHHPSCLPREISPVLTARLLDRDLGRLEWHDLQCIAHAAHERGVDAPWLEPVHAALANARPIPVD